MTPKQILGISGIALTIGHFHGVYYAKTQPFYKDAIRTAYQLGRQSIVDEVMASDIPDQPEAQIKVVMK